MLAKGWMLIGHKIRKAGNRKPTQTQNLEHLALEDAEALSCSSSDNAFTAATRSRDVDGSLIRSLLEKQRDDFWVPTTLGMPVPIYDRNHCRGIRFAYPGTRPWWFLKRRASQITLLPSSAIGLHKQEVPIFKLEPIHKSVAFNKRPFYCPINFKERFHLVHLMSRFCAKTAQKEMEVWDEAAANKFYLFGDPIV